MRIAISGTHYSGKSTLIEHLLEKFPEYESFDEPYLILEEEGHEFSNPPTVEEYEEQLDYALSLINESGENTIFDRSPMDFLGYALVTAQMSGEDFDYEELVSKIEEGLSSLDAIIFLPIEEPDVIEIPRSEDRSFREMVDEKLKELILEDALGLFRDVEILEVTGTIDERTKSIEKFLQRLA